MAWRGWRDAEAAGRRSDGRSAKAAQAGRGGLAVPPYEIETIFEPFRRLHGVVGATPREEGGLTLAVELPYEGD
ncbi:UNVERIFIED_ORG: hypothetical protein FHR35_000664 [Microbispora rosea subsp. rosea]